MTPQNAFLEILTAAFATGETKVYAMAGEYFEIIDSVYPVDVRLVDKYGAQRGLMRNAENSYYIKAGNFDTIEITSASAQTIRFAFGTSEAGTRRTAGVVSVVDGGRARTQANKGFAMSPFSPIAGAGNYAHCQLWNPPGSGVNLVVQSWVISSTTAGGVGVSITNTAQATNATATRVQSKLGGGVVGKGEARTGALAVAPTVLMHNPLVVVNTQVAFNYSEPVVLPPGFGLTAYHGTLNTDLAFGAQWYEEAV